MNAAQEEKISAALEKVFLHYNDAGSRLKDRRTADFVFHMTDWKADLMALAELYAHPDAHTQKDWNEGVFGFLIHAVSHLMAAAKLNNTLYDPFHALTPPKTTDRPKRAVGKRRAAPVALR
jgi:hypothetical protein